jgi:hypothetical protein
MRNRGGQVKYFPFPPPARRCIVFSKLIIIIDFCGGVINDGRSL